jgi:hypothetical protein
VGSNLGHLYREVWAKAKAGGSDFSEKVRKNAWSNVAIGESRTKTSNYQKTSDSKY